MKNILRLISCLFLLTAESQQVTATHIVGGEMIYTCLGNDQYEITLKVFRDCSNPLNAVFDNPAYIFIFDNQGNLLQSLSVPFPGSTILPNPNNPCLIVPPGICVEEADYVTTATLPPIDGGYTIVYERCCRNGTISNLVLPGETGDAFVAEIPDTAFAICNSSPFYTNFPPTIICVDEPFSFEHLATDPDGDSLVYSLCAPFQAASFGCPNPPICGPAIPPPFNTVTYTSPYSFSDPMGGTPPMSIGAQTGVLTVTPNAIGQFVVGICVSEYRGGVLLEEHKRDFQFNVAQCTPTVLASIPSFINECSGYTINFSNNSIGGTDYHWDFGVIGMTDDTSNLFEPTFTFPDTGVYTVTLLVNPGTICGDTAIASVFIYPTFNGAMAAPDGCTGQPVSFFDQSTSSFGNVDSWTWDFGDGGNSTSQDPSHIYSDTGTFTVQLIVGTDLGCLDTITQTITIYPAPPTNVLPSDTTICYLDFVQLNASGSGTFSWQPNYNISNIQVPNPVASPDVTTTYTVTLSNNFGCFTQDSVTIHVFDTVIVNAGNDTTLCPGQSIQLDATGGFVFSWSPTTGLNNPNIPNPIATPPITTTYFLNSSIGSCVGTDQITITIKPFPAIFAGPDITICEGDTAQLSATGGTSYTWDPSGTLNDPTSATPLAFPHSTTIYAVEGLDSNSCDESVIDSQKVIVIPMPNIDISPDTTIILGTCTDLSITGGISYQWFPSTGLSSDTSSTPTACPTEATMYYVYIFTAAGCKYLDSVFIDVNPEPLVIFPNAFSPNDDGKNDYFRPVVLGLATVDEFRIFNRWGVLVFEALNVSVIGGPMPVAQSWNGEFNNVKQPLGVYVYYLKGTGTATGTVIERHGDLTLVR